MNILVINTCPMGPDGITNVIKNLFNAMDKSDMHIDLLAINEPVENVRLMFENAGGKVYVVPRSMSNPIAYLNKLIRLIRHGAYDIVHAHGNSATLVLEMMAAWVAGCRVRIAHSHNTTCKHMIAHKLLSPLFKILCTHSLACGNAAGRWLFGKKEFVVVNNGIQTTRFAFNQEKRINIRQTLGIGSDTKLIGHVGSFNEQKNQRYLIEILEKLEGEYKLLLLGKGHLRESIEQEVQARGLSDRVIFGGVTDRVEDYLCAFDLLVMPSLYEGLPLSLIEAQASGLKCIVSDNITREADKSGNMTFLRLEAGAESWAQTVRTMDVSVDREELSRMAIEKIRENGYDIRTEAEKLKKYYLNAVEKRV